MKLADEGCALCGSTWGDRWEAVDGQRLFFCCDLCAVQFRAMISKVKERTGWAEIDRLELAGDRRGRTGLVFHADSQYRFFVAFNSLGAVRQFRDLPSASS